MTLSTIGSVTAAAINGKMDITIIAANAVSAGIATAAARPINTGLEQINENMLTTKMQAQQQAAQERVHASIPKEELYMQNHPAQNSSTFTRVDHPATRPDQKLEAPRKQLSLKETLELEEARQLAVAGVPDPRIDIKAWEQKVAMGISGLQSNQKYKVQNVTARNNQAKQGFISEMWDTVKHSYANPDKWSLAMTHRLKSFALEVKGDYLESTKKATLLAKEALKMPITDVMAAETGYDQHFRIAAQHTARAGEYSSYAKALRPLTQLGKGVIAAEILEAYGEVKAAAPGDKLRIGIDQTAKIIGSSAGAIAGEVIVIAAAPETSGLSFLASSAMMVGTSSVVGSTFEWGADKLCRIMHI